MAVYSATNPYSQRVHFTALYLEVYTKYTN